MTEQEKIKKAREAFQRGEPFDEGWVRKDILDSWKRSRAYGLTGRTADKRVSPKAEVEARIRQRALFYNIACPFMERLYDFTTDSGYLTAISDEEGYILKMFGDNEIMALANANGLVEGCNRDEKKLGTNGVGTALALGLPIQVSGEEHYFQLHHNWICSGAPVYGPDGNTAGMVCIIGTSDKVSFHTLGMAAAASEAITRQMVMADAYDESERIQNRMKAILETTPSGLLLLDRDLRISQINNKAAQLLGIHPDALLGGSIWSILSKTPKNEKNIADGVTDWDVTVETGGLQRELSVTVSPTEMGEKVITFVPSETLRKRATRLLSTEVRYTFEDIIGSSPAVSDTVAMARIAARLSTNLLLMGETGTGKELIAQAIHNGGSRSHEPYFAINCGAIPKNLIESELFGFEGENAEGRDGRAGKFELANGGTIYLEEIGAMPLDVQAKLNHALQEGAICRLGSEKKIKIDVRIIAASSKDLLTAVRNNEFHGGLYYRLNGLSIHMPALRDRRGDVRLLADYFLHKYAAYSSGIVCGFTEGAYLALENYSWPGNIRELENTVERAVYVCTRELITRDCLPAQIILAAQEEGEAGHGSDTSIVRREQRQIEETLRKCNGNISLAAQMLGISRRTIYRKMEKFGIDPEGLRKGGALK